MTLTACGLAVLAKPWDAHESVSCHLKLYGGIKIS